MIKIEGGSITLAAGGTASFTVTVKGAFQLPEIFEVGVFVEGTVFNGNII